MRLTTSVVVIVEREMSVSVKVLQGGTFNRWKSNQQNQNYYTTKGAVVVENLATLLQLESFKLSTATVKDECFASIKFLESAFCLHVQTNFKQTYKKLNKELNKS